MFNEVKHTDSQFSAPPGKRVMDPNSQYHISSNVPKRAKELVLRRIEWKMLFALATPKVGSDLPERFGITMDRCSAVLKNLMDMGLVETRGGTATPPPPPGAQQIAQPPGVKFPPPPPVFSLPPPPPPEAYVYDDDEDDLPVSELNGVKLKPIIDFIQSASGSGTLGQLTVYRVFLKIPPNLLKEARIQSVKFVDDNFRIESAELQRAIRDAVKKTLKMDVPLDLLPA